MDGIQARREALAELDRWFAKRGFGFVVEKDAAQYWAHLFSRDGFQICAPKYGLGHDAVSAAASARERYRIEEADDGNSDDQR